MKVVLIGNTTATGSSSTALRDAMFYIATEALNRNWTLGIADTPENVAIIDEVRATEKGGTIQIYALEATRTRGRSEDDGMIYAPDTVTLNEAMACDADGVIAVGGIPFGQSPATDDMSPTLQMLGALKEVRPEIKNVALMGFGGNTAQDRFRELSSARDEETTFITSSDPIQAAYEACEAIEFAAT